MRLPRLYRGERRVIFGRLLANGLTQGLLAVCGAWLVMRIFDQVGHTAEIPLLLFAGLLGTVMAGALLRRFERVQAESLGQHYARSLRSRLYVGVLRSDPRRFQKRRKGAVLLKFVGDLSAVRRWISLGLARLLVSGVAVFIALSALVYVHWPFALGVAAVLSLSAMLVLRQSTRLRCAIAEARRSQAGLAGNISEKLNNLLTVQAFGQIKRERRLLRRQSDRLLQTSVAKAEKIGNLRATIDATAGACVAMVLLLAFVAPPADMSAGMIAAMISIIGFLTPPLRDLGRVQEYWLASQVANANLLRLSDGIRRLPERRHDKALFLQQGEIRFVDVSVRGAVNRVTATAEGGSRIAVMGGNGSGKSTLLGLAGRLFDPDKGRVLIDGQRLSRVALSSVRQQIAYVSAEIPLLRGSLRRNLCYGAGRVEADRLQQILEESGLNDLVDQLPDGLQTRIAESGASLSQGERIRVSLARALLRKPNILLLDEADANLDARAIRILDDVVRRFSGTILMVTHRPSALRLCDRRWVMEDGHLASLSNGGKTGFCDKAFNESGAASEKRPMVLSG